MKKYKSSKTMSKQAIEAAKKVNSKQVGRYDKDTGELIETYESLNACKRAGYTNAQGVIEGRRTHCKGFLFRYINN